MRRSIAWKNCWRPRDPGMNTARAIVGIALLICSGLAPAETGSDPADLRNINQGDLVFLTKLPKRPPHLQEMRVLINDDSLRTGWVQTSQCHYRLVRMPALQVVFSPDKVRKLRILRTEQIGRAWVEGSSVQIEQIGANAVLCIFSENRTLHPSGAGGFEWRGGPYMRRFFDGYFPVHLKLNVLYPDSMVQLSSLEPSALQLRSVQQPGQVDIDVLFDGRLNILMHFTSAAPANRLGW